MLQVSASSVTGAPRVVPAGRLRWTVRTGSFISEGWWGWGWGGVGGGGEYQGLGREGAGGSPWGFLETREVGGEGGCHMLIMSTRIILAIHESYMFLA